MHSNRLSLPNSSLPKTKTMQVRIVNTKERSTDTSLDSSVESRESTCDASRRAVALGKSPPQSASSNAIGRILVGEMVGNGGFCEVLDVKILALSSLGEESACPTEELLFYIYF